MTTAGHTYPQIHSTQANAMTASSWINQYTRKHASWQPSTSPLWIGTSQPQAQRLIPQGSYVRGLSSALDLAAGALLPLSRRGDEEGVWEPW